MAPPLTKQILDMQTEAYRGTGGTSQENGCRGFRPAFFDARTRSIHLSRFADGRPAPFHAIDGLPDELVLGRDDSGRAIAIEPCVIAGFVRDGRFYTRDEAAACVRQAL